jgi:hypothetical protein
LFDVDAPQPLKPRASGSIKPPTRLNFVPIMKNSPISDGKSVVSQAAHRHVR